MFKFSLDPEGLIKNKNGIIIITAGAGLVLLWISLKNFVGKTKPGKNEEKIFLRS